MAEPTAEELRKWFSYNPDTGHITHLGRRGVTHGARTGFIKRHGYVEVQVFGRRFLAHRLAWIMVHGKPPEEEIDHINGVRHDNRLCNLREATRRQNAMNRGIPKNNTSGIKGISWNSRDKRWIAMLHANKTRIHVGSFTRKEDAREALEKARAMHCGEFARAE